MLQHQEDEASQVLHSEDEGSLPGILAGGDKASSEELVFQKSDGVFWYFIGMLVAWVYRRIQQFRGR